MAPDDVSCVMQTSWIFPRAKDLSFRSITVRNHADVVACANLALLMPFKNITLYAPSQIKKRSSSFDHDVHQHEDVTAHVTTYITYRD